MNKSLVRRQGNHSVASTFTYSSPLSMIYYFANSQIFITKYYHNHIRYDRILEQYSSLVFLEAISFFFGMILPHIICWLSKMRSSRTQSVHFLIFFIFSCHNTNCHILSTEITFKHT